MRGEAEVAALVGGERRAGEARHPLRDLAPGVAAEPPRHGLARLRVERADGGGPEVYVHSEGGRISRHGSLPTSLRRGCASGTSTTLSQPRPAVTSGGSCRFRAPGLGHSVCPSSTRDVTIAGVVIGKAVLGDVPFLPAVGDTPCAGVASRTLGKMRPGFWPNSGSRFPDEAGCGKCDPEYSSKTGHSFPDAPQTESASHSGAPKRDALSLRKNCRSRMERRLRYSPRISAASSAWLSTT